LGTPAYAADPSTYLVKDIKVGSRGSKPAELVAIGNWQTGVTLYFSADDGKTGRELWKSDATGVGTRRVKDIMPGPGGSSPREMTVMGSRIFFSANDGLRGRELWVTDGTAAGTKRVADIRSGAKGSSPKELTAVGHTLFFTADDGNRGRELWKSDGTATGTRLVRNINKASRFMEDVGAFYSDHTGDLISFRGKLFFSPLRISVGQYDGTVWGELWVSDGTKAGTKPFYLDDYDTILWPEELTKVGSRLYFRAGEDLWRSDGSGAGTRSMGEVSPYELTNVGGTLFFRGNEWLLEDGNWGSTREGLWKSNGTKASTVFVKAFPPTEPWCCQPGVTIDQLTNVDGTLYFTLDEDLWRSDGTTDGTVRIADLPAGRLRAS
jgi:ELWxxDGT repeat protein